MRQRADGQSAIGQVEQPQICKRVTLCESFVRRIAFHVHDFLHHQRILARLTASLIMSRAMSEGVAVVGALAGCVSVRVIVIVTVLVTMIVAVLVTMRGVRSMRVNQRATRVRRLLELFLQPAHHLVQPHSITSSDAPTYGARSILLITSRSERMIPGPPLRGILSPSATSIT